MSLVYYMDAKYIGRVTPEELAVIRGCLLNGADPIDVCRAFDYVFVLELIEEIHQELVKNGRLKN